MGKGKKQKKLHVGGGGWGGENKNSVKGGMIMEEEILVGEKTKTLPWKVNGRC